MKTSHSGRDATYADADSVIYMAIDVTEATFQAEVLERSASIPVVVDLWSPRSPACPPFSAMVEKVVAATQGQVYLVRVNVDESPQIAQAFQLQSVPALYALKDGKVFDGFMGAQPEEVVQKFIEVLLPSPESQMMRGLLDAGDEESLRVALSIEPGNSEAVVAMARIMVRTERATEALQLLTRVPENEDVRKVAASARLALDPVDDFDTQLVELLATVKTDEVARQKYVDILETMGPDDPRTAKYRKQLTARLC